MTYEKSGLYIDEAHLESFAENFARGLKIDGGSGKSEAAALRRCLRELRGLHDALSLKWGGIAAAPGAAHWLLDNDYLVRREGAAAVSALEHTDALRFSGTESVLMRLCTALVRSGLSEVTEARMERFLRGFQRTLILERAELTLLPAGVRAALIGQLPRLYRQVLAESELAAAETECTRIFAALRYFSTADFSALLESCDFVEQTLRQDPAGVYPRMTERSRGAYCRCLSVLARRRRIPEYKAARRVLELAQKGEGAQHHVGYWIFTAPLGETPRTRRGGCYIAANVLLTLFFSLLPGFALQSVAAAVLLLVPVSELVKRAVDFVLLRTARPVHVPRLELKDGVPAEGRTLCVVSAILSDASAAAALAARMEDCYHLSRGAGENLRFALLADLPDSVSADCDGAEAALSAAADAVEALNRKYGGGFFLLTRPRTQTEEGRWRGWERKRGALLETMRMLRGTESAVRVAAGDADALVGTRYLLTLDADTRLTPGAANALIGAMLHPLNAPEIDASGVVRAGHGILSPRIGVELAAAGQNDFSRIFAGRGGTEPYGGACSDLYMDHWGSGGFAGKGIVDIDAYLACMGTRVPADRMLSHDAVEGAFLRAGFIGDVELTDGYPRSVLSWCRREERWIRGDWQNLPWLFRPGHALPDIERWRLFDSLRRSLIPVATFAALLLGFFLPAVGLSVSAAAALLALAGELLFCMLEAMLRRDDGGHERFQSVLFVGVGGGIVRTFLRLLLLPGTAWIALSAAFRALWRMCVSHRRMLEWQTAAQSDGGGKNPGQLCRVFWFGPCFGAALLLFAPGIIGKTAGLLWIFAPLYALLLSLPAASPDQLSAKERERLGDYARDTWAYFSEFLTPEDNYLPPDNFQAQPPTGLSRRTSPTNIGLGLLSVLAAADLHLVGVEHSMELLAEMLTSLERLEKWNGHLYNWYQTADCAPMAPRYVSTVDSGNLCASLVALRGGLLEYDRADLAVRADALAREMDFSLLYDKKRCLFHVGVDPETGEASRSWYDLMSSEARLTGYLAVARGDVPRTHWQRLSRAQVASGVYRGMVSWTGTMFEYLMPELLLPLARDSLLYESARFCLFVQKRRVRGLNAPWGISESAFGALDATMSYRYKAHGCAALALKRGMDDELVVSPYSSFLALAVEPRAAMRNLRALEERGMRGQYGFWEALDFTSSRRFRNAPATVRCVMAHHQGMSLVAAANALLDGVMQRRFLADPAMRAYQGLLQEMIPVGAPVLRRSVRPEQPEKPSRAAPESWTAEGEGTDFLHPRCCPLASQTYSLLFAETGLTRALWGSVSPYVPPETPLEGARGMEFYLDLGGARVPLLPEPDGPAELRYHWRFSTDGASIFAVGETFRAEVSAAVSEEGIGELRQVRLQGLNGTAAEGVLTLHFRPLLARYADYVGHPAFYGLGMSACVREGCLLLRRLPRGETRELWMCLAPSRPCTFDLSPGADGRATRPERAEAAPRFLTDPQVNAVCPVALTPDGTVSISFALAMAYRAADALQSAREMLSDFAAADLPRTAAAIIGMEPETVEQGCAMLPYLAFPTAPEAPVAREALWRFGISGDLPVVCAEISEDGQMDWARRLMDCHLYLCGCGQSFDLVFLSKDGVGYQKPLSGALSAALWRKGGEVLRDCQGGVHILEAGAETAAVRASAALRLAPDAPSPFPPRRTDYRALFPVCPPRAPLQEAVRYEWNRNGAFVFYVNRSLPPRAWQNILTNGRFGYLATDCGSGNLWYLNARENQLTPWLCEPNAVTGPEKLMLASGGATQSLFAAPQGTACRVRYLPGAAVWETQCSGGVTLRVTAFVPPDTDARVLLIDCAAPPEGALLHWRLRLQLAGERRAARCCRTAQGGGFLAAENPQAMAQAREKPFLAMATGGILRFTFDAASALALDYDGRTDTTGTPVFAAALPLRRHMALVCGCDRPETLRALTEPDAAQRALEQTLAHWQGILSRISLRSPEEALDRLMNGWLAYQALSCRLLGRCSVYQSGGAYGFRDQLQDAVNLILLDPSLAREQILRCCRRQYTEGDVQHWWHEGGETPRGVRTRCSDDLLWLPWALCEYTEKTGDLALCTEETPYLTSPPLEAQEHDRYEAAETASGEETVLAHCHRAITRVMARGTGEHGLLRIGAGDWNDGFDRVGGESVWLSWFFLLTADRFAALCKRLNSEADLTALHRFSDALAAAANAAWDGKWFLRGYYASGAPLGSAGNTECRIDSVAQSFAALSGRADSARAEQALQSALELLFDRKHGVVKLFDPPFAGAEHPGYVESYGPGFRENGGQYTHGAIWLALALLQNGHADDGWELLRAMLPANHDPAVYRAEPFVLAADVYSAAGHIGEAGWSWYTGAAGWMLRTVTEGLLGLRMRGGLLYVEPNLPAHWSGYTVICRGRRIEVSGSRVTIDGRLWDGRGVHMDTPHS